MLVAEAHHSPVSDLKLSELLVPEPLSQAPDSTADLDHVAGHQLPVAAGPRPLVAAADRQLPGIAGQDPAAGQDLATGPALRKSLMNIELRAHL